MFQHHRTLPWLPLLLAGCTAPTVGPAPTTLEHPTADVVIHTTSGTPLRMTVERDPSKHRVAAPLAKSWGELAKVYDALGIPLEYADHRTNRAGNTRFVMSRTLAGQPVSTFLRCGYGAAGALADTHRVRMHIATELKATAGDSTAVYTQIEALASPMDGTSTTTTNCTSTGALEMAIVQLLKQQVGEAFRRPRG
jgi:hypothetical protein